MNTRLTIAAIAFVSVVSTVAVVRLNARQAAGAAGHTVVQPNQVKFAPIEVPGFNSGMKIAAIHGDPNADSGMYVIRLEFPAGYRFPAHWHPNAENLTVLSGELLLGMGEKEDAAKLMSYRPGAFMHIPSKMPHFGGAKGMTVIQLHGEAPFKIELVKTTTASK
jgi:quercetin dioxygenase-like cupin family protein